MTQKRFSIVFRLKSNNMIDRSQQFTRNFIMDGVQEKDLRYQISHDSV